MWLALTVAMLVGLSPGKSADSTFILRYDLPVGKTYTYRVTTDQFILPTTGLRLHTLMNMDVVGRDENSHVICRLRLTSDTAFDRTDMVTYRPVGELNFGGHRLYSDAGFLELRMDEQGNLIDNRTKLDDASRTPATSTQFERITDASLVSGSNANGPYMLQLLMPTVPEGSSIEVSKVYTDTVTFASRSVHLPTSYGATGVAQREVLYDTVIRRSSLDSVYSSGSISIGHMTIRSERRNALGGRYESTASVVRDMRSGMIQHVREKCYRLSRNGDKKISYYATAELINTQALKISGVSEGSR